MIEAERVLYYFEHLALMLDEDQSLLEGGKLDDKEREFHTQHLKKFFDIFYIFCHVGTAAMHSCQHPDWEKRFLEYEQKMIDDGYMTPYEVQKKKDRSKSEVPDFYPNVKPHAVIEGNKDAH